MASGRAIFDQSPTGMALLDGDGRIVDLNPAFEALVDLSDRELRGQRLGTVLPQSQADAIDDLVRSATAGMGDVRAEAVLTTRGGSTRLAAFVLTPLEVDGDEPGRVLVTADDVTADRSATIRIAHDQKLEELGRLASGIAHEIRSPLQYVITSLDYIRTTVDDLIAGRAQLDGIGAELVEAIEEVTEGVRRINEISAGMNTLAHLPSAELQTCDLADMLGFPLAVARGLAPAGTEIVRHPPDADLPAVVVQNGRVQQALLNILINAVHAIEDRRSAQPRHTGRIDVLCDHDDDAVVVTVVDDGVGMDATTKAQATEPFFTTKAEGRGTGQGLSLVREVLVEHGGSLTITSVPGEGTTVTLAFPRSSPSPNPQVHSARAD